MDQPDPERDTAAEDALRRLEARLDRASEAAERLLTEAAARIGGAGAGSAPPRTPENPNAAARHPPDDTSLAGQPASSGEEAAAAGEGDEQAAAPPGAEEPPPAGWQIPGRDGSTPGRDLDLLLGAVQSLRNLIPADLQRRLTEALRELLLAVRALIDWYLERVERRRAEPAEVQDIPIE